MYSKETGRTVKIVTKAFNKEMVREKMTDQILGCKVAGIGEVKDMPNGDKCLTLTYKSAGRDKYATLFGQADIEKFVATGIKEGDFFNANVIASSPVFPMKDAKTGEIKGHIAPRMCKIVDIEKGEAPQTIA